MPKKSPKGYLLPLLLALLLLSLAANLTIFQIAWNNYKEANSVRLNPLGLSVYPTDQAQAVEKEAGQKVVVFFGDSRAVQWRFPKGPEMEANFIFIDRGIEDQTSSQIAGRFEAHIRPLQPDIIVLQMCINDLKTIPLFPESKDAIVENCQTNIDHIITKSQAINATLILTTVFPFGELPPERLLLWSDDVFDALQEVNAYIQTLAGEDVIIFDTYTILAGENGRVQEQYRFEFLHVNGRAYEALNRQLTEILLSLES